MSKLGEREDPKCQKTKMDIESGERFAKKQYERKKCLAVTQKRQTGIEKSEKFRGFYKF